METIENGRVIFFDVDGTLVDVDHNREIIGTYFHNVDQLKRHHERGFFVVVWSANGYKHALDVVEELNLQRYVDQIMTKPSAYFDDKHADDWMKKVFVND